MTTLMNALGMFKCLAALDPSDQSLLLQLATCGNVVFIATVYFYFIK